MTDKQLKELQEIRLLISEKVIPWVEKIMLNSCCLDFDEYETQERYQSDAIYYLKEIVERLWMID